MGKSYLHSLQKYIIYFYKGKVSQNKFNIRAINFRNIGIFRTTFKKKN